MILIEKEVSPARESYKHRPSTDSAESGVSFMVRKRVCLTGDKLAKVRHLDVNHATLLVRDLNKPQQRFGVGLCDSHSRNFRSEELRGQYTLSKTGAAQGVYLLNGAPDVWRAQPAHLFPYDFVCSSCALSDPKQWTIDSNTADLVQIVHTLKGRTDSGSSVISYTGATEFQLAVWHVLRYAPAKLAHSTWIEAQNKHRHNLEVMRRFPELSLSAGLAPGLH